MPCLVNLISKDTHPVFSISWQASRCQHAFSKPCLVNLISKDTHLVFSIFRQASQCQHAFSKPCLVNLISKDTHLVFSICHVLVHTRRDCKDRLDEGSPESAVYTVRPCDICPEIQAHCDMQVDGGGWMVSTIGSGGNLIKNDLRLLWLDQVLIRLEWGATFIFEHSWFDSDDEPLILIA